VATESGAAIFRAIADFSRLRREARNTKKDLKDLGNETERTNTKLGDTDQQASKTSGGLAKLGAALQKMQAGWAKFEKSDAGKTFHKMAAAGDRLGSVLHSIRNKIVAVSGIALAATASIGPVLGLVGAVVSLSGAVGAVPGILLAAGAAGAVLKVAFLGVSDVLKNLGERDLTKFNESIKNLPEPMRKVARAAWEIQPALDAIKKSIQSRFWSGLEVPLKDLAGKYLPMVSAQGTRLAGTFNLMAKEFASFLGQKSSVADVNTMLGNTNSLFKGLVGGVKPLAQALLDIFKVSSEFLPAMGKGIAGATQKFAEFIRGARESGKLKDWIQTGLTALKQLGAALINIGRIFVAIFKAGGDAGRGFFGTLKEITDRLATFLESARGQEALGKLFTAAAAAAAVLLPVVEALFLALADIIPILVKIGAKIGPGVVDLIRGLHQAIVSAEPGLVALGAAVGDLLSAIGNAGPLLNLLVQALVWAAAPLGILAGLIRLLSGLFAGLPGPLQTVIGLMLGFGLAGLSSLLIIGKLAGGLFGLFGTLGKGIAVLNLLKPALLAVGVALRALGAAALANPIILIIAAIAAIALLIILNWDTVKVWLAAFWTWLTSSATAAWQAVVAAVTAALAAIVSGVVTAWSAVWQAISNAMSWIVGGLTAGWNAAWQAVSTALSWIKGGVSGAVGWVGDKIRWLIDLLGGAFSAAWHGAKDAVVGVVNGIGNAVTWLVDKVRDAVRWIKEALSNIGSAVSGAVSNVGSALNPVNWFAKGGLVPGTGSRDSVPLMATPGEYVEPAAVTKKWLPLLRAINPHDTGRPAEVPAMLGVNDLLRNAAGGADIAAQIASSVALSSGRTAGADTTTGRPVGDVHVTQIIHNPAPEKPSETAAKRIGRAATFGVHVALNGAA
jgi:hypothetical protein